MRKYLESRLSALNAKKEKLTARSQESTDINEVRSINEQMTEINEEIRAINEQLAELEARNTPPADAKLVNGDVARSVVGSFAAPEKREGNPYESMEYREAFKNYVQNGTAIPVEIVARCNAFRDALPAEQRAGVAVTTTDTGAAIPLTVMNEVINTVRKRYGNLYRKVTHTNIKGGVQYSVGALAASFKWINESTVSPRQKVDALAKVEFSYHTAEIRVAQSFLSQLLTVTDFEAKLVEVIVVAYLQAMDKAIVAGTGEGMPLGILNDTRVPAGNVVTMSAADMSNWTAWRKKFFAKLPLGYRDGEFIFPISTVDSYLETMADGNNNPIFRQATGLEVNDGDALNPNGRFFGRDISLVEPDILPDFDAASSNDVVGIFWQPRNYAINENFGFVMRRYFDEETNEWVDKALVVVDGKLINPEGIFLIKKA